jgi:hypothetical protein
MVIRYYHNAIIAMALGLTVFCTASLGANGQSAPPASPSASLYIHQVQIAFIGSGTAGGGTLYFQGQTYPFKLGGLGIGGIGISTIDANGWVYNLRQLTDFNGVYGQLRKGWAIGQQGGGEMWLQNSNGVILRLRARRQGLALSLGADGMVVRLGS